MYGVTNAESLRAQEVSDALFGLAGQEEIESPAVRKLRLTADRWRIAAAHYKKQADTCQEAFLARMNKALAAAAKLTRMANDLKARGL